MGKGEDANEWLKQLIENAKSQPSHESFWDGSDPNWVLVEKEGAYLPFHTETGQMFWVSESELSSDDALLEMREKGMRVISYAEQQSILEYLRAEKNL